MSIKDNRFRIGINKYIVIVDNIIYTILFWGTFVWPNYDFSTMRELSISLFPWICILMVLQIINYRVIAVSKYDYMLWYSMLSYLFMFGNVIRDVFNLETTLIWNPLVKYSPDSLYQTYCFVVIALQFVVLGYLMVYKTNDSIDNLTYANNEADKTEFNIGMCLLIIGGVSRIITDLTVVLTVRVANTYAAYTGAIGSGMFDDLATLLLPGVAFIVFSNVPKERTKRILLFSLMTYLVVVMVNSGTRKTQIFSILTVLLIWLAQRVARKVNIFKYITVFVVGVFVINVIIVLRDSRHSLSSFSSNFMTHLEQNGLFGSIIGEVLAETSLTVLSVASIILLVPSVLPFQYGLTFLRAIPSVLPIGWLVGDFFKEASSTNVINTKIGVPAGSSIIGDLYWNWGLVGGWIAAFVFGILVSKLFHWVSSKNGRYRRAIYFSIYSQLIIMVRASVFDVFRPIAYMLLAIFVLDRMFNGGKTNE